MAIHNLLKAVFNWQGDGEIGTLSVWMVGSNATHSPAELSAAAGDIATGINSGTAPTAQTNLRARLLSVQSLTTIQLYEYANGDEPASSIGQATYAGTKTGTAASNLFPLQVSHCVTLQTALSGRSYTGRMYVPLQGIALDANGEVPQAGMDATALVATGLASAAVTAVGTSLSVSTLDWCVFSRKLQVANEVTSVRVDSRPDIQRRRANSQNIARRSVYSA